jgi:hypothetical protein
MDELLNWCRQERSMMLDSIGRMERGELRLGEQRSSGLVDQTPEWIATLKGRVAELDALLATYGQSNAPRP